jgi:hypothetical protein
MRSRKLVLRPLRIANAKGPARAEPFLLMSDGQRDLEVHPTHTAHSAASRRYAAAGCVLLRQFGHYGFGGDQQCRNRGCVLDRGAGPGRLNVPKQRQPLFVDLSKIDRAPFAQPGHTRIMAAKSEMLTREEFASLFAVGNTSAIVDPPVIPAEHSTRLIALGYMVDLAGRLRMTTSGRLRMRMENQ